MKRFSKSFERRRLFDRKAAPRNFSCFLSTACFQTLSSATGRHENRPQPQGFMRLFSRGPFRQDTCGPEQILCECVHSKRVKMRVKTINRSIFTEPVFDGNAPDSRLLALRPFVRPGHRDYKCGLAHENHPHHLSCVPATPDGISPTFRDHSKTTH